MEAFRPLTGQDLNGFVRNAIVKNLVLQVGQIPECEQFKDELEKGEFVVDHISREDGGPDWETFVYQQTMESGTGNCLDVSWFFLEFYVYRRVLGLLGYFLEDNSNYQKDPWGQMKVESFDNAIGVIKSLEGTEVESTIEHLFNWSIWSMATSRSSEDIKGLLDMPSQNFMLLNDTSEAESLLSHPERRQRRVIIILNGCGLELLADLRLANALATRDNRTVELHVPPYPCGPISVTRADVENYIDRMVAEGLRIGQTLRELVDTSQIVIVSDDFYASPQELALVPPDLKERFEQAAAVIVKGDRGYRRTLGDRYLPLEFHFADVAARITTSPIVLLRVCESPLLCGLTESERQRLESIENGEFYTGQTYAIAQSSYRSMVEPVEALFVTEDAETQMDLNAATQPHDDAYDSQTTQAAPSSTDYHEMHNGDIDGVAAHRSSSYDGNNDLSMLDEDPLLMQDDLVDLGPTGTSPRAEDDLLSNASTQGNKRDASHISGNSNETEASKQQRTAAATSTTTTTAAENDDVLHDAEDILWDPSRSSAGLDVYLEDIGTKDANRPFINIKLPPRAYSAFEYFCRTRPGEDELTLAEVWASMIRPQKQKYETQAQSDKARYEKELIAKAREVARIIDRAVRSASSGGQHY